MNAAWFESSAWIQPLGWTLLHSIWQIALIATVYSVSVLTLRAASANARYLAGCAALLMMLAVSVGTFLWLSGQASNVATTFAPTEHDWIESSEAIGSSEPVNHPQPLALEVVREKAGSPAKPIATTLTETRDLLFDNWTERIEPWLPWLSTVWLIGALLLSLRPLWGWFLVRRLQTQGHNPLSADLQVLADRLVQRM